MAITPEEKALRRRMRDVLRDLHRLICHRNLIYMSKYEYVEIDERK
jgi:hypothetical protein